MPQGVARMFLPRFRIASSVIVCALVLVVGPIGVASAQGAWVDDRGSLTAGLSYEYVPSSAIILSPDRDIPDRPTRNHVITVSAEYVPINKLGLSVSLPLAMVQYNGTATHTPKGAWDDGKLHTT